MHFNGKFIVIEGGAVPDIGNTFVESIVVLDRYCINAGFGAKLILQFDIGCRNAK